MVTNRARTPAGSPGPVRKTDTVALTPSAMTEIVAVLAKHNPSAPKAAIRRAASVFAATLENGVAHAPIRSRSSHARPMNRAAGDLRRPAALDAPVEESQGEGFGEVLSTDQGRRRVIDYATPVRMEDWAGPVAGPAEIERHFGTRRSTLHEWQKRGAVIGLLRGERKHVYPLAQFVDGRPIEGMSRITKIIANPRAAWLWLVTPHPNGDEASPLERLKQGRTDEVAAAAQQDFG
ncbi:hypothetical protein DFR50_123122 [Roseiarcus fermentans]|uniref:Antitoxin Xre/MbcA/ParS-like middle domain-containing protein n=1 Tax=Roseiarcus fermentans TaxID=1473586 RepID=A0A366F5B0_9HYPH|nr:hypothetical protein [Roseiarcus fermentans]RBP09150.1 hypothetical protein DFR50_123122 [Roseiarcus fermentans]